MPLPLMSLMPLHLASFGPQVSNLRTLRSLHQAEMLEDATWAGGTFRIISLLLVTIKAQTSRISHDACRYGPLLALGLYHSVNVLAVFPEDPEERE